MEGREKLWPSCLMWLMSPGNVSPLPQVQLQDNSSDCGVFVLQYVESLLKVSSTTTLLSQEVLVWKDVTHFPLHLFPSVAECQRERAPPLLPRRLGQL